MRISGGSGLTSCSGHLATGARVSGEKGQITMGQCIAEVSARRCLKRKWPQHFRSGHTGTQSCED
eukprot:6086160-Pyramimonas_sp.AAC.1